MYRLRLIVFTLFFPAYPILSSQIVNIESQRINSDTTGFDGHLDASVSMSQNTRFLFSVYGKAQVQYKWKNDLLLLLGDYNFTTGDGERFLNNGMGHLRYNHKFLPWLRYEAFTQLQYNELLQVRLRFLAGTGPRFKLTPWDKYKVYIGTLYMFEYEEVAVDDTIHRDHRLSAYLAWSINPGKVFSFNATTYYQPLFKDWSDFRVSGSYALTFRVWKRLAFKVEYIMTYDSRPPTDVPSLNYTLKTGVVFNFRP